MEPVEGRVAWIEIGSDNKRSSYPTYLRHWSPALIAKVYSSVTLNTISCFIHLAFPEHNVAQEGEVISTLYVVGLSGLHVISEPTAHRRCLPVIQ